MTAMPRDRQPAPVDSAPRDRLGHGATALLVLTCLVVGAGSGADRRLFERPGWPYGKRDRVEETVLRCGMLIEPAGRIGPPAREQAAGYEARSGDSAEGSWREAVGAANPESIRP